MAGAKRSVPRLRVARADTHQRLRLGPRCVAFDAVVFFASVCSMTYLHQVSQYRIAPPPVSGRECAADLIDQAFL
ncbi:MAG TPA: hypothetical protein VGZ22_07295, partial [Isosphaeraceae bacterium]|nr:hypothetical protein [Isosphaeraceae bacterium]